MSLFDAWRIIAITNVAGVLVLFGILRKLSQIRSDWMKEKRREQYPYVF